MGTSPVEPITRDPPRVIGRYELHARIATGGMASVHYGRLVGPVGFSRTVAIKRLHPQFAQDPEFVAMFLDEARLAGRIRHPNVVPTLDVVALEEELFLVMDYVQGESLGKLVRLASSRGEHVPTPVLAAIFLNVLDGLHAAHEVTDDSGQLLGIVHRDVSPQNIIVGVDGVARVLDFGVAKARGRVHHTHSGTTKGKIAYMAPEQLRATSEVTRAADIYAAGVCLWEALTGRRLFQADSDAALLQLVLAQTIESPSRVRPDVPAPLAELTMKAVSPDPTDRPATAQAMARAVVAVTRPAAAMEVAEWVRSLAGEALSKRAAVIADIERDSDAHVSREAKRFVDRLKGPPGDTDEVEVGIEHLRSSSAVVATASTTAPPPLVGRRVGTRKALGAIALIAVTMVVVIVSVTMRRASSASATSTSSSAPVLPAAAATAPPSSDTSSETSAPSVVDPPVPVASAPPTPRSARPSRSTPIAAPAPRIVGKPVPTSSPPKPAQASDGLFDR